MHSHFGQHRDVALHCEQDPLQLLISLAVLQMAFSGGAAALRDFNGVVGNDPGDGSEIRLEGVWWYVACVSARYNIILHGRKCGGQARDSVFRPSLGPIAPSKQMCDQLTAVFRANRSSPIIRGVPVKQIKHCDKCTQMGCFAE